MNTSLKKIIVLIVGGILVMSIVSILLQSHRSDDARREIEETSLALWKQGFKTHFSDFYFTTDSATYARAVSLLVFDDPLQFTLDGNRPDFLPVVSDDTATIIWKQNWLKTKSDTVAWQDLHTVLDTNRGALDAACFAALSGPIRFEPRVGDFDQMWGEHVEQLRYLLDALSSRAMLELHDDNFDAAWTNLLAATRIVTAWEPEPTSLAYVSRASFAETVSCATWQALQNTRWPDTRLADLQQEWAAANFFTNLSETAAFERLVAVRCCQQLALQNPFEDFSVSDFGRELFRNPLDAVSEIHSGVSQIRYRGRQQLTDEKNLLLYFRDREIELRHLIQSPTWAEMRALPGFTNVPVFKSPYPPAREFTETLQPMWIALLVNTSVNEARRRILITAIALERYRGKHGAYPATLATLTPEFLKTVPADFMDGQPLRYRLTDDGHFVLYSVGLDCVDDGGKLPLPSRTKLPPAGSGALSIPQNVDLVWPRPAAP